MNCPICDKPMSEREKHEFIAGSGGAPYEFRVHVCHSAGRGIEPGEKAGRRCEETLYYEPLRRLNDDRPTLPMLVTGLDPAPAPEAAASPGSSSPVEEDAR